MPKRFCVCPKTAFLDQTRERPKTDIKGCKLDTVSETADIPIILKPWMLTTIHTDLSELKLSSDELDF